MRKVSVMTRSAANAIGTALVVGLSLVGCSSGSQPVHRDPSTAHGAVRVAALAKPGRAPKVSAAVTVGPTPPPAIATAAPDQHPGIALGINSLHRDGAGVVILTWTLKNNSAQSFLALTAFNSISKYSGQGVTDVTLLDADHKIRYHTLRDAQTNYCVCTVMGITGDHTGIDPGNNATYYDAYTLPGDISRVTVEIPGFVAVKDVPIN